MGSAPVPIDTPKKSIYYKPTPFAYGGAGMVTTPADFDRFLAMLVGKGQLDGKRVMSEATALMGMSNLLPSTAVTKGTWVEGQGFGAGGRVGLGNTRKQVAQQ